MADEQFSLGEAIGGYEQAKGERDFYLSMMQQGQRNKGAFMASPIAAYLAGVANVKMGSMRSKIEQEKDARDAAEKAMQRKDNIRSNMFQIAKAARDGSIDKSVAGALMGYQVKELGATPISYDADNGILDYRYDGEDYELDLNEKPSTLQQSRAMRLAQQEQNLEAGKVRAEQAKKKGELDIALKQKRLADTGTKKETDAWSTYSAQYKDALEDMDLFSDNALVSMLGAEGVAGMIQDAKALPKSRQEALSRKLNRLRDIAKRYNIELEKAEMKDTISELRSLWDKQ